VSLSAINSFKGLAEGTKASLNLLDKPECGTLLFFTGMFTDWTADTDLGHFAVPVCNLTFPGFSGRLFV